MSRIDALLAILPLVPSLVLLIQLMEHPSDTLKRWYTHFVLSQDIIIINNNNNNIHSLEQQTPTVATQLLAYILMALVGYSLTTLMVPSIQVYTLRKGICGKDLGKRGTRQGEQPIPEALGIVPGAVFLVCLLFCLVGFAATYPSRMLDVNAALLSICFMLFLGFTDDVLDWPWRYKLVLPSVASLPLLCSYKGSTSVVVPLQLRSWLWNDGHSTAFGDFLGRFVVVDAQATGALINLGYFYLLYMGLLAVFCTNAINIFAGINGLEAGQSYVIGCAVLLHNLIEIQKDGPADNHLFSVMLMLSFLGVTLGLLRHNWYPATVFVGDTFCYFAGMTFAVVGILGHFSKTLLLLFIPQVINFLWSTPQLFKLVPCPRHRLPRYDPTRQVMFPSTFPCKAHEYMWLKSLQGLSKSATELPNMTVPNLCLQICGPQSEVQLCRLLLLLQVICCGFGFVCRYYLAQYIFDE